MSPSAAFEERPVSNGNAIVKPQVDGFGTRAIHAGSEPSEETGAVIRPISLSTTYKQSAIGIHKVSFVTGLVLPRANYVTGL